MTVYETDGPGVGYVLLMSVVGAVLVGRSDRITGPLVGVLDRSRTAG